MAVRDVLGQVGLPAPMAELASRRCTELIQQLAGGEVLAGVVDIYPVPQKPGNLLLARREFLALIGTSGSGKTTLLKLINRLIEPTRGSVAVDGKPLAGDDPAHLRRRIGYVFQGVGLFPHMTVAENIAVTLRLLRWERSASDARV